MSLLKSKKRRERERKKERERVIDFIANNAAKNEFINWLNANYEQQFPEEAGWDKVRQEVLKNTAIHAGALHNYAGTLTDQEDVTKLLKDVEKETEKAEETVSKLYDTANAKRLRPIIGGASILGGFLLLITSAGLLIGFTEFQVAEDMRLFFATVCGVYGLLNCFGGILLILD